MLTEARELDAEAFGEFLSNRTLDDLERMQEALRIAIAMHAGSARQQAAAKLVEASRAEQLLKDLTPRGPRKERDDKGRKRGKRKPKAEVETETSSDSGEL